MSASTLERARTLAALGLVVIPIPSPRPGVAAGRPGDGKVPAIAWRDFQDRRPTDRELRRWFATESNLAVVTGAISGVVAVDADSLEALLWCTTRLPYTPWQTRTGKGFHLFYRHPGIRVANRARIVSVDGRLEVDVRGDGGFVIAPGSVHATGARYVEAGDWTMPRTALPRFELAWVQSPSVAALPSPSQPLRRSSGDLDVLERARRYLAAIPQPEIGAGSDAATLYAACRLTRGFSLAEADAEALLWEWAGGRPGWTREWITRKVAHAAKYGSEPVGALR